MTRYVALLRGVNIGPNKRVPMADLRAMAERMGFTDVATILQSGNLVFSAAKGTPASLEKALEAECAERIGVETDFLVRTAAEWRAIVAANPFPKEAKADPARLVVVCLKAAATAAAVKALEAAIPGREVVRAKGRELYAYYPDGQGTSKLTPALIDRELGTRGTARNWNTTLKLEAACAARKG
jgi:uncharacterized protein (DUF1697 family)